jgi:hypothetical protein
LLGIEAGFCVLVLERDDNPAQVAGRIGEKSLEQFGRFRNER